MAVRNLMVMRSLDDYLYISPYRQLKNHKVAEKRCRMARYAILAGGHSISSYIVILAI
ncbi:hypothetical protein [Xanthomonas graminis]|uniref:hypothetical protein n=1 Tax=Xanthomonas graminis TaxID=3390026 RepID=UPI0012DA83EF|nr:hypothetical protein [Xanthomonas translucens]